MRLKYLEIQGFKSFPDKTRLEFNDGITAVIGPNGSGKSNISDAVRWVLGEQSTRTLRGSKMEDVIFGGTQARKPQGMASVTLMIDNAGRLLPFEADEVAVTRRLYRTGDSEYRINGAQVRLKDIVELFLDTGLGRDGYSIIGQGKVAEIVSAKSRERREIFEEAAGISRYRYRKTEAEKRLALAEDNLTRLRDILAELTARVEPLREQSKKAEKFLTLSSEKKSLEVSVWVRAIRAARAKLNALEDELVLAKARHGEAEQEAAGFEDAFEAVMEEMQRLSAGIEEARDAAAKAQANIGALDSEEAVLKNDIAHNERSAGETRLSLESAGRSAGELRSEILKAEAALSERLERLDGFDGRLGFQEEARRALEAGQAGILKKLELLRQRRSGVYEAIDAAKLDAATSATLLGESEERLSQIGQNARTAKENLERLREEERECAALLSELDEKLQGLENAEKGYQLKRASRREKFDDAAAKEADCARRANEKEQRAKVLSDMDRNMEGFGQSVKTVMAGVKAGRLDGVFGPVSSLISVEAEYTTAVETALGGAMQNIVVRDEEIAKRAIGLLRTAKAGRATFLPLTSVKGNRLDTRGFSRTEGFVGLACDLVRADAKFDGIIASLLGRVAVARDLDGAASLAKANGYRFRIVTLDGQLVNAGGSFTGGYTAKSAGVLGRRDEIRRLREEAAAILAERDKVSAERAALERELRQFDAEIESIGAGKKTLFEDRVRCESEAKRVRKSIGEAAAAAETAQREHLALMGRIEEYREKSAGSGGLIEQLSKELDGVQAEIETVSGERETAAAEIAEIDRKIGEERTGRLLAERDVQEGRETLERLRAAAESGERQRAGLLQKCAALEAENARAAQRIGEIDAARKAQREAIREREAAAAEMLAKRTVCERRQTECRAGGRESAAKRDELYRQVVRLGENQKSIEAEHDGLIAKLWDEYELTRSDAEALAEPVEDPSAANRRLAELRAKIKNLGTVNVGAIEEFKEVSERHGALSAQLSDVERSKAELTRLIGELTGEMREIFSRQFGEINRHFGQIFTELFGGGRAQLSLTDQEDILESGIEINVQPPGKVIKNLAALSGGEQSFVAIAIFFAILRVNPAPFCLMDEIEAALDDVNVGKFAAYLRTMTDKTQFIAITHRRGTMEEADVLYGVTMQEDGVSKLLELKVSEIEKGFGAKD